MKHLFVPYKLALLAKEKGFDEPCFGWFQPELGYTEVQINWNSDNPHKNSIFEKDSTIGEVVAAPLYQQINHFLYNIGIKTQDELKFHSDANWQYEAIEWIEKTHRCTFEIQSDFIGVNALKEAKLSYWVIINKYPLDKMGMKPEDLNPFEAIEFNDYLSSRKEAIFEALYQFSQYLKQKK